jgi:hypothetical protein
MYVGVLKNIVLGLATVIIVLFSGASVLAAPEQTTNDGFTAVAGTENVVMDRRQKNNTAVISGFILAVCTLLVMGALRHVKTKKPSED